MKIPKSIANDIANHYVVDILNTICYESYGYMQGLAVDVDYYEEDFRAKIEENGFEATKANLKVVNDSFTKQLTNVQKKVIKIFDSELKRYLPKNDESILPS